MLDSKSLQQLKQLKQDIDASKERAEGVVKATQGRYGFVVLEDSSEVFLPPHEMERVLPGDRVRVVIHRDGKKAKAELEALVEQGLKEFAARCAQRKDAVFAVPDVPQLKRWLFIPKSARRNVQPEDFIYCRLQRHPFKDGKPQAKILHHIGPPERPGIEADYVVAKHRLSASPAIEISTFEDAQAAQRKDFTHLPLVTIDSAQTEDMDDALAVEATDNGWKLWVAIADPDAYIAAASELDNNARERATTTYLPGRTLSMLPEVLAHEHCSLRPEADRPALLCELGIAADGAVSGCDFHLATVRSRAKLSYQDVDAHLAGHSVQSPELPLDALMAAATARRQWREREQLVMAARDEYQLQLDDRGKIADIIRHAPSRARQLVEECMVAVNTSAAEFLREQTAAFTTHPGIRSTRHKHMRKLLQQCLPEQAERDFKQLDGYVAIMQQLQRSDAELPLPAVAGRWLARSTLQHKPAPHFGMGVNSYATVTSPLRKYSDLLNHRAIKARLGVAPAPTIDESLLDVLQQRAERSRLARNEMEHWLKCQYLAGRVGESFAGTIVHVNSNGFGVRLTATGIDGFVDLRGGGRKHSFESHLMQLRGEGVLYQLGQSVQVTVAQVNEAERSIAFELTGPA